MAPRNPTLDPFPRLFPFPSTPATICPGRHRLAVAAIRIALASLGAAAAHAQTATAPATQPPASTAEQPAHPALPPTTVRTQRDRPVAGTATVLTADDLERNHAARPSDIVRYEPLVGAPSTSGGSIWDSGGNTGYNVRGIEGNRVSLDIDGILLPDAAPKPDGNSVNAFGIGREYYDPETFREVRIQSGTSLAGPGGSGLGGSVRFATKAPEDYLHDGHGTYGAYKFGYFGADRSRLHSLTGAARLGNVQGLAVEVRRDGHAQENRGTTRPNPTDWSSDAFLGKLVWGADTDARLGLTLDHYRREEGRDVLSATGRYYPQGVAQASDARRTRIGLEQGYAPAGGTALFDRIESRVYWQDASVDDRTDALYTFGSPSQRAIDTGLSTRSVGLAFQADKTLGPAHTLQYGLGLDRTDTARPWSERRVVRATGAVQSTSKNRMADTDTTRAHAFARDEIAFALGGRRATLTPGLRFDFRKDDPQRDGYAVAVPAAAAELRGARDSALSPSLAFALELAPGFTGFAQYGRGSRFPTAAERTGTYDSFSYTGAGTGYAVLGNPDLRKETADAFEVGIDGRPADGLTVRASAFHTRYRDFIEYVAQPYDRERYPTITQGLYRPANFGRARIRGLEFSGRAALGTWSRPLDGFSLRLAAGVAEGRAEARGQRSGLASVAPARGSLGVGYDDPGKAFGGALIASGAKGRQAPADLVSAVGSAGNFRVPGYGILDLTGYWHINRHATLSLGLYNLTDRKYWDYAGVRALAASATSEIERQSRPGRTVAASLSVRF